jgi:hypothetical protein
MRNKVSPMALKFCREPECLKDVLNVNIPGIADVLTAFYGY